MPRNDETIDDPATGQIIHEAIREHTETCDEPLALCMVCSDTFGLVKY